MVTISGRGFRSLSRCYRHRNAARALAESDLGIALVGLIWRLTSRSREGETSAEVTFAELTVGFLERSPPPSQSLVSAAGKSDLEASPGEPPWE